jgi:HlyD family secretion protein
MKKLLVFVLILSIAVGVFFYFKSGDGEEHETKIPFKTTPVIRGDLVVKISATGVVEPSFQVEVKSKASGEVLSFPFEEGDFVKKGTLLIQLDKSDEERNVAKAQADLSSAQANFKRAKTALLLQKNRYETNLRSAESQVQEAEANLKEAKNKLARQEDLHRKKFASQEALDEARTAFKVNQENLVQAKSDLVAARDSVHDIEVKKHEIELARADVKRSKITLDEAQERLEETEIFSPLTGVLISKLVERGQIISSGISNVSGGTALATIADMSRLYIVADVDETDIGAVQVGQQVKITTDAYPGKTFEGKVSRIAPKGEVENSITIFKVKIEILGEGKSILKPMMSGNVDIINQELNDVLYLPREAVRKKGEVQYAAILVNDLPEEVPVKLGVQNPIHTQVVSGLEAGQEVLVGDWEKILADHQKGNDKMSTIRKMLFILRSK